MTNANVRSYEYIADFLPLATTSFFLCWVTSPCFSCVKLSRGYCEAVQCPVNTVDRHSGNLESIYASYIQFATSSTLENLWSRDVFENLIILQLVKKYPTFYGTRSIISVHTSPTLVPILNQINQVHVLWSCICKIYFKIILPSLPRPSRHFPPSGFTIKYTMKLIPL